MMDETPYDLSQGDVPEASVRRRYFSAIWLIPIIAAVIASYLAVRAYVEHGPIVMVTFHTADGLTAGQTAVRYKSVVLGTVEDISLNKELSGVIVHIRMNAKTDRVLTDHARFWVVKPHLMSTSLSDIVSGTYIEVDPGEAGGKKQTQFIGLENVPALPADQPGTTYLLKADQLGAINIGSPVYYRDMNVGEVLGYDFGNGFGPVSIKVFVHPPYDKFIKPNSRFWNASGLSVRVGAGGVHVELQSLQSLLAGGIAFSTPDDASNAPQADAKTIFLLYENRKMADASAASGQRVSYVTYFQNPITDLAAGSVVQIFGIPVGQVTDVKLSYDPQNNQPKVRVAFEIVPDRAFGPSSTSDGNDAGQIMRHLVDKGMRVKLEATDLITSHQVLSLQFAPKAEGAEVTMEGDAMVLPGQGGGFDAVSGAIGDIANKLNQIPFEEIGRNLNHLIASADQTIGGDEMHQAVHSLAVTMANAEQLSHTAHDNLTPALQKLPEISAQLQSAVTNANQFMASINTGYGGDSDFQRNAKHVLDEVNDAARSIRLLADYLDRHPEALLQGKSSAPKTETKPDVKDKP